MTTEVEQQILEKLLKIEKEVGEIEEHIVDTDTVLTKEERKLLDQSIKHEKEGNLISLEDIKNVRNKAG